MLADIVIPDFASNAVRIGYEHLPTPAKRYDLADYRRALTVHPLQMTTADLAGPFGAIYLRRFEAWQCQPKSIEDFGF